MSVVLVCFPGAPKISEEAVKKEEELDKYLEARVEGERSGSCCPDSHHLVDLWDLGHHLFSSLYLDKSLFSRSLALDFSDCCHLRM